MCYGKCFQIIIYGGGSLRMTKKMQRTDTLNTRKLNLMFDGAINTYFLMKIHFFVLWNYELEKFPTNRHHAIINGFLIITIN